jgi:hypothetical protein
MSVREIKNDSGSESEFFDRFWISIPGYISEYIYHDTLKSMVEIRSFFTEDVQLDIRHSHTQMILATFCYHASLN